MNVREVNEALSAGALAEEGIFPHLDMLQRSPFVFSPRFGLDALPESPGLISVRGSRQYGKSTWLESQVKRTIEDFGPGSAFYLNGDDLRDEGALIRSVRELTPLFSSQSPVRRLFIDEITAIANWQRGLKLLLDAGEARRVLIVTTGSKATDLRRGTERLPGRKGQLERTSYLFLPVSYAEFKRVCGEHLKQDILTAYVLSGGCPIACAEMAARGRLPEFVPDMIKDWIYGECALSGRHRSSLVAVMECLFRFGGTPVGQAKLAREAGLANNTVAAGYVELLMDLMCAASSHAWDSSRHIRLMRKPCKVPFINMLAAASWHPAKLRSVRDFHALSSEQQGMMLEWQVAQEIWRRAALRGEEFPEIMAFWQGKDHELDFVLDPHTFLEVKRGNAGPLEWAWFPQRFPRGRLTVIAARSFETDRIRGISMEDFLLEAP